MSFSPADKVVAAGYYTTVKASSTSPVTYKGTDTGAAVPAPAVAEAANYPGPAADGMI